jgi:hypothetical protein
MERGACLSMGRHLTLTHIAMANHYQDDTRDLLKDVRCVIMGCREYGVGQSCCFNASILASSRWNERWQGE